MMFVSDFIEILRCLSLGKRYKYRNFSLIELEDHLDKAVKWIINSVKFSPDEGSSQSYRIFLGWNKSFPETTGYIIPTLFDYINYSPKEEYILRDLAVTMGKWLVSVQLDNGSCMQGLYYGHKQDQKPIVFNTGQNLLGYLRLFQETHDDEFYDAAIRSANFLLDCQNDTGAYIKYCYNDLTASYNVRSAWAVLMLGKHFEISRYIDAAYKNIMWTLNQQDSNGWFKYNEFKNNKNVNTHAIAYVLEGLIGSYFLLREKKLLDAVILTTEGMLRRFEIRGWIAGEHDEFFKYKSYYSCVTGNIQLAGVWLDLFKITKDMRYLSGSLKLLDWVLQYHNITSDNLGIRGGIPGSIPLWGRYAPFKFPNWAAKFFVDTSLKLLRNRSMLVEAHNEKNCYINTIS
jgi:hypothetical protein